MAHEERKFRGTRNFLAGIYVDVTWGSSAPPPPHLDRTLPLTPTQIHPQICLKLIRIKFWYPDRVRTSHRISLYLRKMTKLLFQVCLNLWTNNYALYIRISIVQTLQTQKKCQKENYFCNYYLQLLFLQASVMPDYFYIPFIIFLNFYNKPISLLQYKLLKSLLMQIYCDLPLDHE